MNKAQLGFIGASYFMGFLLGAAYFSRKTDKFGRLYTFRKYFVLELMGIIIALLTPSIYGLYLSMLLIGCGNPLRIGSSILFVLECTEKKYMTI